MGAKGAATAMQSHMHQSRRLDRSVAYPQPMAVRTWGRLLGFTPSSPDSPLSLKFVATPPESASSQETSLRSPTRPPPRPSGAACGSERLAMPLARRELRCRRRGRLVQFGRRRDLRRRGLRGPAPRSRLKRPQQRLRILPTESCRNAGLSHLKRYVPRKKRGSAAAGGCKSLLRALGIAGGVAR